MRGNRRALAPATMRSLPLLLCLVAPVALAKPASSDWMSKNASFTQADIVNACGASLASAVKAAMPDTLDVQMVNILMVDKQGLTQIEVLCSSTAIYEMQNGSEFTRRGALNGTHEAAFKALTGGASGGGGAVGYFGVAWPPASASEKVVGDFLSSREAGDVVVSIGWAAKEGSAVYTTLYSDRIEMNPDAPKAKK
jgi:hypothetical protein